MSITPYPLCWPIGWQRTAMRSWRQPFKGATFARGRDRLSVELERLGAESPILSTSIPLRLDGQPRGDFNASSVTDPGVAIYFAIKGKQMVLARDEYSGVIENITSLALAIEYLRGLRRHGGATMMEMAFSGFAALPTPGNRPSCWAVLGLAGESAAEEIERAFREASRVRHPDVGGSDSAMIELNQARSDALRAVGAA